MPSDSKRPSCELYNDEMAPLNNGHALWQPAPHSYFERVQPGDVGYIRDGGFNLLFSAGSPPPPLKKLKIGRVLQLQPQIPGCLTGNQKATVVTKPQRSPAQGTSDPMLEPGSNIQFQSKEKRGAALVTKYQTYKENVQAVGAFNKYVKENYASWVEFARDEGHGDVNPVLVTGLDRTKYFAMMCYSNHEGGLDCEFNTSTSETASGSAWGSWNTTKPVHVNHGPQQPPFSTHTEDSTPPSSDRAQNCSDKYNQCVFVRYFTMRNRRFGIPKVIKAGAGPHNPDTGKHDDGGLPPYVHDDSDSDSDTASSLFDSDGDDDTGSVTSVETEPDVVVHNTTFDSKDDFDVIADYVFQNSDAESVLLHHQDIALLRETGRNVDLATQLLEKRPQIMVDGNGVGTILPQADFSPEAAPNGPATPSPRITPKLDSDIFTAVLPDFAYDTDSPGIFHRPPPPTLARHRQKLPDTLPSQAGEQDTFSSSLASSILQPQTPWELVERDAIDRNRRRGRAIFLHPTTCPEPIILPPLLAFPEPTHPETTQPTLPHYTNVTSPPNWFQIPQTPYNAGKQWGYRPSSPILFTIGGSPGISLRDALREEFAGLDGRDDLLFGGCGSSISCRIQFSGYPVNGGSYQIRTLDWSKPRKSITRGKLAYEIAGKIERYLTQMARVTPDKHVDDYWKIGQGFMHIENMFLVNLKQCSKESFQPEIWVAPPLPGTHSKSIHPAEAHNQFSSP